jgi:hypothetical protein
MDTAFLANPAAKPFSASYDLELAYLHTRSYKRLSALAGEGCATVATCLQYQRYH